MAFERVHILMEHDEIGLSQAAGKKTFAAWRGTSNCTLTLLSCSSSSLIQTKSLNRRRTFESFSLKTGKFVCGNEHSVRLMRVTDDEDAFGAMIEQEFAQLTH